MSRVSFAMRKQYLHQQLSDLNNKAKEISRKFMELHKYAAAVARGRMTLIDLAGMPNSCGPMSKSFVFGYMNNVIPKAMSRAKILWANDKCGEAFSPKTFENNTFWDYNIIGKGGEIENILKTNPDVFKDPVKAAQLIQQSREDKALSFENTIRLMSERPDDYKNILGKIYNNDEAKSNEQIMRHDFMMHMYDEALKAEEAEFRKAKEAEIKVAEDELQQEKLMNDSRLTAVKEELGNVEKAEPEAIKRSMGQYA